MLFKINDASANVVDNTRNLVRCGMMAALSVATLSFATTAAQAGQATTTLDVTITINDACALDAASTPIAFAAVDNLNTATTATGVIFANCTQGTQFLIEMDAGKNSVAGTSTDFNNRRMKGGKFGIDYVGYDVYKPSGATYSTCDYASGIWGNTGVVGGPKLSYTGTGNKQPVSVCGKLKTSNTTPPQGNYIDILTATINY